MTTHPNSPLHHDGDLGALSEQQPTVLPGYLAEKLTEQQIAVSAVQRLGAERDDADYYEIAKGFAQEADASEAARVAAEAKLAQTDHAFAKQHEQHSRLYGELVDMKAKLAAIGEQSQAGLDTTAGKWFYQSRLVVINDLLSSAPVAPAPTDDLEVVIGRALSSAHRLSETGRMDDRLAAERIASLVVLARGGTAVPSEATTDETSGLLGWEWFRHVLERSKEEMQKTPESAWPSWYRERVFAQRAEQDAQVPPVTGARPSDAHRRRLARSTVIDGDMSIEGEPLSPPGFFEKLQRNPYPDRTPHFIPAGPNRIDDQGITPTETEVER